MVFSGFDSAWGRRRKGALCHLGLREDGSLEFLAPPGICGWEEATQWTRAMSWQNHVVAIDQSLVVRNVAGMRPVERKLAQALMRDFGCGAHASNTTNPCYGPAGGIWDFVEALESRGYRQDPLSVAERRPGRFYFECFPHPALLGLFDLDALLAYKVRRRDRSAWRRLLQLLRSLEERAPRLRGIAVYAHARLPQTLDNENRLDSIVAAYVGAWWWRHGTRRSVSLGSLSDGYIVTPVSQRTRAAFAAVFSASEMNERGRATCGRPT